MKMLNGAPKPPRAGTLMARREKEEEDQGKMALGSSWDPGGAEHMDEERGWRCAG
jgi:hypothetical protein